MIVKVPMQLVRLVADSRLAVGRLGNPVAGKSLDRLRVGRLGGRRGQREQGTREAGDEDPRRAAVPPGPRDDTTPTKRHRALPPGEAAKPSPVATNVAPDVCSLTPIPCPPPKQLRSQRKQGPFRCLRTSALRMAREHDLYPHLYLSVLVDSHLTLGRGRLGAANPTSAKHMSKRMLFGNGCPVALQMEGARRKFATFTRESLASDRPAAASTTHDQ